MDIAAVDPFLQARADADAFSGVVRIERSREWCSIAVMASRGGRGAYRAAQSTGSHTSGIGDDADEDDGVAYETVFANRPNYSITETVDFLAQCAHNEPKFAPGEGTRYCNCSYVLLGLMVERASGLPYRDYVLQHVFGPAGMNRSGFFRMDRSSATSRRARTPSRTPAAPSSGGGAGSTAIRRSARRTAALT